MENSTKKRYSVTVSGVPLNLITDESEEFLAKLADNLSSQINAITNQSFCVSKLDAAILCALDAMGEGDKAAAKVRTLEAQISVLQMDLQSIREELDSLRDDNAPSKPMPDKRTSEEKVKDLEKFLDSKFSSIK